MSPTAKVIESTDKDGAHYSWLIHCPGCDAPHSLDKRWTFNGDVEKPTFRASLLVYQSENETGIVHPRCHSFITDGQIQFLADCGHALAGKTVELPAWKAKHPGPYRGTRE